MHNIRIDQDIFDWSQITGMTVKIISKNLFQSFTELFDNIELRKVQIYIQNKDWNKTIQFNTSLANLHHLTIQQAKLQQFIMVSPFLQFLDLSFNELPFIDLTNFKFLNTINLSRNLLQRLNLEQSTHLKIINISYNNLENLQIKTNSLIELRLNSNPSLKSSGITSQIKPDQITILSIQNTTIHSSFINQFKNLQQLSIKDPTVSLIKRHIYLKLLNEQEFHNYPINIPLEYRTNRLDLRKIQYQLQELSEMNLI